LKNLLKIFRVRVVLQVLEDSPVVLAIQEYLELKVLLVLRVTLDHKVNQVDWDNKDRKVKAELQDLKEIWVLQEYQ
jgi:hypothetical protein